jgi:hypothetical protein
VANSVRLSQATDMSHGGAGVQEEFRQDIARFWTVWTLYTSYYMYRCFTPKERETSFVRALCGCTGACEPPAARSKHYREVGVSPDLRHAYRQARHPLNSHRRCRSGVEHFYTSPRDKVIRVPSARFQRRCVCTYTPGFSPQEYCGLCAGIAFILIRSWTAT